MKQRIFFHAVFWLTFVLLYVVIRMLFPTASDSVYPAAQQFFRFLIAELAFLPWKIIPFYFLFYFLIPRYFSKAQYGTMAFLFLVVLIICLLGYRSMIVPVSQWMYSEVPGFNVFALRRILFSLTEILPAVALASTVKLLKDATIAQRKEQALQKEKRIAELNFLKAQSNPHFLFNTLNNLYGLARRQDQNTAASIMKLSNIMRYILSECSSETIAIEKEVRIIDDYIELEKLRYDERLKLRFEKNIDNVLQAIAPLILLAFVENAFKHGASESRFETFVFIQLSLNDGILRYCIENSKASEDQIIEEGIGLKNVRRQLELIYANKYSLEVRDEAERFFIELNIDLNKESHD